MAGGVLNAINTRLDARNIATILRHSEAKIFFVDYEYVPLASETLRLLRMELKECSMVEDSMPLVIVIDDIDTPTGVRLGKWEYELLINQGNPQYHGEELEDEWDAIALNYTSGTTANPKGVVYSHRGAFLSTISAILEAIKNLVSVQKFTTDSKCSIDFDPYALTIRDYHTRQTLLRCDSTGDLYPLHVVASAFALLTNNHSPLWHQRLGHPGDAIIQTLSSRGL
ncbi:butyrate--CoA ligase AAE11, peroxisomal-like protein, partial [Tanacetum coccineum]